MLMVKSNVNHGFFVWWQIVFRLLDTVQVQETGGRSTGQPSDSLSPVDRSPGDVSE